MRLACIGPLSPLRSGVAHFSENWLPYLAKRCDIRLFTAGFSPSPTPILQRFPAADISEFVSDPSAFDAVLYHMGNHYRYHRRVFDALCLVPGMVLLHDCVLNPFFAKYALERGDFEVFRRLFDLCYGNNFHEEAALFCKAKGDPYQFPMAGVTAMCSRGTIVMNDYARGIVSKEAPTANVLTIRQPYFPVQAPSESVQALRKKFRVPEKCFVVISIGTMTPTKRIDVALEAFRKFHHEFPDAFFLLAGESTARLPVDEMIEKGSLKNVRYLGYLRDCEFHELLELADACINLRYPSNGEMSSTLIHMLGHGKVVAISNYAQFAEFPDDVCVKINLGPAESDELAAELLRLARDKDRRDRIGGAARTYILENHSPDAEADAIVKFLEDHVTTEPPLPRRDIEGLLVPDALFRRSRQRIAYNTRVLLSYLHERGMVRTLRQAIRHARAKAT